MFSKAFARRFSPLQRMIAELATTLSALCLLGVASGNRLEYLIATFLLWYTVGNVACNVVTLSETSLAGAIAFARIYQWAAIIGVGCALEASISGSKGVATIAIFSGSVLLIFQYAFFTTVLLWTQTKGGTDV